MENTIAMFIFLLLLFAIFYFLIIRPQRRRQREHQELMTSLKRGDKVITIGGIYGQIESVTEDNLVLKVESGAVIKMHKGSIACKQDTVS